MDAPPICFVSWRAPLRATSLESTNQHF